VLTLLVRSLIERVDSVREHEGEIVGIQKLLSAAVQVGVKVEPDLVKCRARTQG
jgi:hypothetical protein